MKAGVFYPASRFQPETLLAGVEKFRAVTGLEVEVPELPSAVAGYAIGDRGSRARSLVHLMADPGIEVLWAARGGYGTVEILPDLLRRPEAWRKRRVVGFSDLTALHAFLSNLGLVSWHAPMAASKLWLEAGEAEAAAFRRAVLGESMFPVPCRGGLRTRGRLVGGNLTVLASLMGTPWQLELQAGDIIFLEDIGEAHYRLARSLYQLSHTPNFGDCTILWGQLTECAHEFADTDTLIARLMEPYGLPCAWGVAAGHSLPNLPLRLGSLAEVDGEMLAFPG